jgi:hypothetical protein
MAIVSSQTHDPAIHKLQQSLLNMRTDGHARLKSIKVMVIKNTTGLSARCPATLKELKTKILKRLPLFHRKRQRRLAMSSLSQSTNVLIVKEITGETLYSRNRTFV